MFVVFETAATPEQLAALDATSQAIKEFEIDGADVDVPALPTGIVLADDAYHTSLAGGGSMSETAI